MSLSREFAAFVAGLRYEDLPPAVVDRAKGVTLQALSSALVAHDMPASKQALALMQDEEAGAGGNGTVLCRGMFDHVWIERGAILELKIVENAAPDAIERSAEAFGMAIQAHAYRRALELLRPDLAGKTRP